MTYNFIKMILKCYPSANYIYSICKCEKINIEKWYLTTSVLFVLYICLKY